MCIYIYIMRWVNRRLIFAKLRTTLIFFFIRYIYQNCMKIY